MSRADARQLNKINNKGMPGCSILLYNCRANAMDGVSLSYTCMASAISGGLRMHAGTWLGSLLAITQQFIKINNCAWE